MAAGLASGGDVLDPDGAMERLSAGKGRIDELAADTRTMSDRLRELRVTAADPNGSAEVTADSAGALVDLRLGTRIQRVVPQVVAATIMDTVDETEGMPADHAQEITAETVGTESAAARAVAARAERRLRDGTDAGDPQGRR